MRPVEKTFVEATTTPSSYGRGSVSICRRGKDGNILVAAINRPKVKNALNDDFYEDFIGILEQTKNDPTLSVVVWTGVGSYFSSGADINDGHFDALDVNRRGGGADGGGSGSPPSYFMDQPGGRFMLAIVSFPKVLCAAVNGPVVGIAATALMQCDLVYFTDTAFFWAPFSRLALVPELTSSVTFLETMGLSKANELLLLGKRINAQKALDWGICSQIISDCVKDDPFHTQSLASHVCQELDKRLLSLPNGPATAQVFCDLIKGGTRRSRMQQALMSEVSILDQRFKNGEVMEAAKQLTIGKAANPKNKPRSRL